MRPTASEAASVLAFGVCCCHGLRSAKLLGSKPPTVRETTNTTHSARMVTHSSPASALRSFDALKNPRVASSEVLSYQSPPLSIRRCMGTLVLTGSIECVRVFQSIIWHYLMCVLV